MGLVVIFCSLFKKEILQTLHFIESDKVLPRMKKQNITTEPVISVWFYPLYH